MLPLCDKSFRQSSNLQTHKRHVHSDRKPYYCPYCGTLFKTAQNVKKHARVHRDAKPYSCRHCSESFRWRATLYMCWSHTMKELGSRVTFVRRNSPTNLNCRITYVDMKVWSRMFAMNVKSVSVQQANRRIISWLTPTLKAFVVVYVERIVSVQQQLNVTLSVVLMVSNVTVFYEINIACS